MDKVDVKVYEIHLAKQTKIQEIRNRMRTRMRTRMKEVEEIQLFKMMAKSDTIMQLMLVELAELDGSDPILPLLEEKNSLKE